MDDHETLVLWSGPSREIFEEGSLHPNSLRAKAEQ
jgi:hypothetical protein